MTESGSNGLLNLYLGPLSSFAGCQNKTERNELSISVDFRCDITKTYPSAEKVETTVKDVLWDEKVVKLECGADKVAELNPYGPNPGLHWSQVSESTDRNTLQLAHCNNFDSYHAGRNFFQEQNLKEEFEDKVRYHTEKCDVFRGFVNVYDSNTGYGGVLSKLMPLMDDLYGRKPKLTFGIGENQPDLFEFDGILGESICAFLPRNFKKGFYNGLLNQETPYHNSALHSLFLQQIMQITDGMDFKDFTAYLSPLSRTLITAFMGVPFDNTTDRSLQGLFSPNNLLENVKPVSLFTNKMVLPLQYSYISCSNVAGLANNHKFFSSLTKVTGESRIFSSTTRYSYNAAGIVLSEAFPQFFGDKILSDGFLRAKHQTVRSKPVTKLPVVTVLQNTAQSASLIEEVMKQKIVVNKSTELLTVGVFQEDVADARQRLGELLDNYSM